MMTEDYLKNGKVYVSSETFAIVKSKAIMSDAFATICSKSEITVVIAQPKVRDEYVSEIDKGWKMLTFDMVLPLDLVGFLAKVARVLADENISVFAISAYSTDHILVKEENLDRAIAGLTELGCVVVDRVDCGDIDKRIDTSGG